MVHSRSIIGISLRSVAIGADSRVCTNATRRQNNHSCWSWLTIAGSRRRKQRLEDGAGGGFLSGTLYSRLPSGGPAVLGPSGTLTNEDGLVTHGRKAITAQLMAATGNRVSSNDGRKVMGLERRLPSKNSCSRKWRTSNSATRDGKHEVRTDWTTCFFCFLCADYFKNFWTSLLSFAAYFFVCNLFFVFCFLFAGYQFYGYHINCLVVSWLPILLII
jgi:hypothetical protein